MPKKYKHITLDDRTLIQTQLQQGFKPAAIAASLGRHRSCVTRELARNGWKTPSAARSVGRPAIAGGYSSSRANLRARKLSVMPRVERKLVVGNSLWCKVSDGLQQGLSPEQVAGTLRRMNEPVRLCHETIYQAIYAMPKGGLRTDMIALLRQGHTKRRPRSRGVDRRGQIPNMTSIDLRPADIAERLVPGHWEGDHIKGASNRSQVGTLVERKTRYVALVKLCNGTAPETTKGFGTILKRFDVDLRRSLAPMTRDARWRNMRSSRKTLASKFTSLTRTALGSAAKTKIPMACCVSICLRVLTSPSPRSKILMTSRGSSIPDPENR